MSQKKAKALRRKIYDLLRKGKLRPENANKFYQKMKKEM